jgi:hypothetical protein
MNYVLALRLVSEFSKSILLQFGSPFDVNEENYASGHRKQKLKTESIKAVE